MRHWGGREVGRIASVRRLLKARGIVGSAQDQLIADLSSKVIAADKRECGRLLGLTLAEHKRASIKGIWPCDVSEAVFKADLLERRRESSKACSAKRRAAERLRKAKASDLSERSDVLYTLLSEGERKVSWLAASVATHAAWQRPDGQRLPKESLERIVRRILDDLVKDGRILERREVGSRGQSVRLVRRRSALKVNADTRTRGQKPVDNT